MRDTETGDGGTANKNYKQEKGLIKGTGQENNKLNGKKINETGINGKGKDD